jgi:predicted negative regulator of RcsB-dependent stress response
MIEDSPENPTAFHFKSIPYLWLYLDSKDDDNLKSFLSYSEIVINKAQQLMETEPDNPYYHYLIGTTYSYRALAFARSEEYLNALWATKIFFSSLNSALEIDSSYYDAFLGLGIYNFAASQTAPAWKWALELTGISGDKNIGFQYLNLSAKKGTWSKIEARFYLSQLLSEFFLDLKTAEKYLIELNQKYPGNLLFKLAMAELNIKKNELTGSEKKLREVLDSPDTLFKQIKCYSKFSLANIFFFENNFDSALVYYKDFLESSSDNHFKGIAAFRSGLCYSFADQPEDAKLYFEMTSEGNPDLDEDRYAKAKSEEYLENPPDSIELKLQYVNNLIRSGKYKLAIDSVNSILADSTSENLKAAALLYLSDALYFNNRFKESLNHAITAFKIENSESWIKPFACYFAARASQKLNNNLDANLFIRYAGNYSDYFYENKLKNLLYSLSYSINK